MIKPTNDNTVDEIKAFLDAQNVDYKGIRVKSELLALAQSIEEEEPAVCVPQHDGKWTKEELVSNHGFSGMIRDFMSVSLKKNERYTIDEAMKLVNEMKGKLF